jgi:hypothetical protein
MPIGFTAEELIEQFREALGPPTARPILALSRDDQELLRKLIERMALQIAAKAIELNNQKLEKDLRPEQA